VLWIRNRSLVGGTSVHGERSPSLLHQACVSASASHQPTVIRIHNWDLLVTTKAPRMLPCPRLCAPCPAHGIRAPESLETGPGENCHYGHRNRTKYGWMQNDPQQPTFLTGFKIVTLIQGGMNELLRCIRAPSYAEGAAIRHQEGLGGCCETQCFHELAARCPRIPAIS
jgi:hypothetical protein